MTRNSVVAVFAGVLLATVAARGQTTWYVDDDAENDPGPGDPTVSDPNEDGSAEHPFDAIQEAIDAATDGDLVAVAAGLYRGAGNHDLDFAGRMITVRSQAGPDTCIIECAAYQQGFVFRSGEALDTLVDGFTIASETGEGGSGISCYGSSPTISNCVITGFGGSGIRCVNQCDPLIVRCEISDNSSGRHGAGVTCADRCSPALVACTIARNSAPFDGGGVFCEDGCEPTILDCEIVDNTTGVNGGGIHCAHDSTATIVGCEIVDNEAGAGGGGVFCRSDSTLIIADCTIARNASRGWMRGGGGVSFGGDSLAIIDSIIRENEAHWYGGGVFCDRGLLTITGCDISENVAYVAGGGLSCSGSLTIADCTIERNTASTRGGGVEWEGGDANIRRCSITGNQTGPSGAGGGAYCYDNATFTNCVISENVAGDLGGGGVFCEGGTALTNCTLIGNSAERYGGGAIHSWEWGGDVVLANCISWGNLPTEIVALSEVTATYSDIEGGWPGEGNIDADPRLAFADHARVMPESPCVDAGTNQPPGGLPPGDFDGHSRSSDGDDDGSWVADMGAYEIDPNHAELAFSPGALEFVAYPGAIEVFEGTLAIRGSGGHVSGEALSWQIDESCPWLAVDPNHGESMGEVQEVTVSVDASGLPHGTHRCALLISDSGDASGPRTVWVVLDVASGYPAIQTLIDTAEAGGAVIVPDGTYTGPENRNLDFRGKALTLRSAGGPENCKIDCEYKGSGFVFHNGEGAASVVEGFTIANGKAASGGGIFCSNGDPTIRDCVIVGNIATAAGGGVGVSYSSNPTLIDCVIMQNSGGGFYGWSGSPSFVNCIFRENLGSGIFVAGDNQARIAGCKFEANTAAYGGGIWCGEGGSYYFCRPTITDCVFEANSADYGGAVYCDRNTGPTIVDCLIRSNTASYDGGGIACKGWQHRPAIRECVIAANVAASGGGGISCSGGEPTIVNCRISGNLAESGTGGGIRSVSASSTIVNCEITENSAEGGGGVFLSGSGASISDCTIVGNAAQRGGGARVRVGSDLVIANSIVWDNEASAAGDEIDIGDPDQPTSVTVRFNDLRTGDEAVEVADGSSLVWGAGNIEADPLFIDSDGPDGDPDTWEDNDYRLSAGSPCIDAGDNTSVPADSTDLDGDGDTRERTPIELDGSPRFIDDVDTDDTGVAEPPVHPEVVDMGAYEFLACFADLDDDRDVDLVDLAALLSNYGATSRVSYHDGDLDGDGDVDLADLSALLGVYRTVCE